MRIMKSAVSVLAAAAMAAPLVLAVPAAEAGPRHFRGTHFSHSGYRHYGYRHHGRGYWRDGRWIALGVGAAIAGAAIADRDCYWRHGYRYCY